MILDITFEDNDFTQIIEELLDKCKNDLEIVMAGILGKYNTGKDEDIDIFIRKDSEIRKLVGIVYSGDKYGNDTIEQVIDRVRESIMYYIEENYKDKYKYLERCLKIVPVKYVRSKWENGEVVHWFVSYHKYITM